MKVKLQIKVLKLDPAASLPTYSYVGPFGDLCADLRSLDRHEIDPDTVIRVGIGIALEIPPEYGALIEDRSGLAAKGLCTLGGVIDPGYRGEIQVILANVGRNQITINPGDRIAQLRIVKRISADFVEASSVANTDRGSGGFGSTGS
ncbi:MAG TPA: dUTP diphosphatase [Candidatus Angelobacter sp.]|jgi:dUTP pyrophosphatase|nr:dUTP diphosphatase [Candidatus Angelobacter sp.]